MIVDSKFNIKNLQLFTLWKYLSVRRRKQFGLVLILMIFASIAEIISVGAVIPFLGILTAPDRIYQHQLMQPFNNILNITSPEQLLLPLTIAFILAALVAAAIRLTLLYAITRLSYATGSDLSIDIYRRTLHQDYITHISRNSSEVINSIITKTNMVIGGIINPTLNLASSAIIIMAILCALFVIDIVAALSASLGFGALYFVVIHFTKKKLKDNSQTIANESTQMVKSLQEGLGGIRDVIIDSSQEFYIKIYRNADLSVRKALGDNVFIAGGPRFVMEGIGMTIIAVITYTLSLRGDGIASAIPMLGAIALGAQRLLPAIQVSYSSYSSLKGSYASFEDVLGLLNQPLPKHLLQAIGQKKLQKTILFNKEIVLKDINFRYSTNDTWSLKNVNLKITKGTRIGFVGVTGSGKTTLLDIIMGLLSTSSGEFTIDGQPITDDNKRAWQSHISHVPQNIYLADATIEENVAFGFPQDKIDHNRVQRAAKKAQISELIEGWKDGYQTFVGERGIRLSGGQCQRVGIARAFYRQADVLIFDEGTSALDYETERTIMKAVEELGKEMTILIIAHRITSLKGCNQIVKLNKNGTIDTGSYQEIVDAQT